MYGSLRARLNGAGADAAQDVAYVPYESELWDDWDEKCHGDIENDENWEEWPHLWRWHCCERPGNDGGCKVSLHRPEINTDKATS